MAAGDITVFDEAKLALLDGTHDLDSDTIRLAFGDNTLTPTAALATPTLSDVTTVSGGNFPATPTSLTVSLSETGGTVTFDVTNNPSFSSNGSNPSNVYWGYIYNDTATGDPLIAFVEIDTGGFDATGGDLTVTWNASGIFTLA